jgi:hypothetical protein
MTTLWSRPAELTGDGDAVANFRDTAGVAAIDRRPAAETASVTLFRIIVAIMKLIPVVLKEERAVPFIAEMAGGLSAGRILFSLITALFKALWLVHDGLPHWTPQPCNWRVAGGKSDLAGPP